MAAVPEGWTLPMPPKDLVVGIVAVLVFLPAVVIFTRLFTSSREPVAVPSSGTASAKQQPKRSRRD